MHHETDLRGIRQRCVREFISIVWRIQLARQSGPPPVHCGTIVGFVLVEPSFQSLFARRSHLSMIELVEVRGYLPS